MLFLTFLFIYLSSPIFIPSTHYRINIIQPSFSCLLGREDGLLGRSFGHSQSARFFFVYLSSWCVVKCDRERFRHKQDTAQAIHEQTKKVFKTFFFEHFFSHEVAESLSLASLSISIQHITSFWLLSFSAPCVSFSLPSTSSTEPLVLLFFQFFFVYTKSPHYVLNFSRH